MLLLRLGYCDQCKTSSPRRRRRVGRAGGARAGACTPVHRMRHLFYRGQQLGQHLRGDGVNLLGARRRRGPGGAAGVRTRRSPAQAEQQQQGNQQHHEEAPIATPTTAPTRTCQRQPGSFEGEEQQQNAQQQVQPEEGEDREEAQELARKAAWLIPRNLPSSGSLCSFPMPPPPQTHASTCTYTNAHTHMHAQHILHYFGIKFKNANENHGEGTHTSQRFCLLAPSSCRRDEFFTHATVQQPTQQHTKQVSAVLQRKWSRFGQRKRTLLKQRAHAKGVATTRLNPPSTRTRCAAAS